MEFIRSHIAGIGFALFMLVIVAAIYISEENAIENTKIAQLQTCERVNLLRVDLNKKSEIVRQFFLDAAAARKQDALMSKRLGDLESWRKNKATSESYAKSARDYKALRYTNCLETYKQKKTVYQDLPPVVTVVQP